MTISRKFVDFVETEIIGATIPGDFPASAWPEITLEPVRSLGGGSSDNYCRHNKATSRPQPELPRPPHV